MNKVHFSSERHTWETPPELFARYHSQHSFTLDAAALPENTKCPRFFSPEDNGLAQDWGRETVWLNPPYGRAIIDWMRKAYQASLSGATVVCLVPSRTDTKWWHDYAMRGDIEFLRGRVTFVGAPHPAPFPCAVVTFRPAQP